MRRWRAQRVVKTWHSGLYSTYARGHLRCTLSLTICRHSLAHAPLSPLGARCRIYKLCALLGTPTPATWPDGPALAARLGFRLPQLPPARLTSLMPHASPEAVSLLEAMLRWDPAARPTAAGCFAHPFFARHMPVPGVLGLPPQLAAVAAVTGSGGAAVAAVEARGATAAHHRQQQSQQLGETRLIDGDRVAAAASPSLAGAGGAAAQHPGSLPPARGGAVDVTESLLAAAAGPGRSPAAQAEPPAASAVGAVGVAAKRPRSGGGNGTGASSGPAAASSPLESSVASLYATRSNDGRVQPHGPSGSPQPLLQQRDVPATMAAKPLATASVAVRAAAQAGLQQQPRRSGAGGGGVSPLDIDGLLAQFEASRPTAAAAAAPAAPSSYRLSASGGAAAVGRVSSAGSRLPPTSPLRAASGGGDEMPSLSEPPARRRPPVPPQLAYQQQQYLYQQPPPFPNAGASAPAAPHGYAAAHGNSNSFGHVADVTPAVVRALQHAPATRYGSSAGGGGGGGDNVGVVDPYTRLRAGSSGSGGSSGVGTYSCAGPSRTQPNQQYQQQPQQQQRGGYDGVGGGSGSAYASPALNPAPAGRRSMTQPQPQQVHPFQAPPLAAPSFGGGLGLELGFAGIGSGSSARLGGALPAAAHQPQSGTARSTSIFSSGGSSSSYSSRDEAPLSSSLFSQPTYGGGNGGGGGGGGVFGTFGRGATATAIPPLAAPTAGRRSGGGGGGSIFDSPGRLRDEPQLPPPPLSRQQQQQYGYLHPHHQQQQPPAAVAGYVSSSGVAMSGAAAAQQYQQQQQHGRYQQL